MNPLVFPAWAGDLGWALLHSLWQVAVVAALLWALLTLLHRASPRLRHGLALGALLLSAAWPASTYVQRRQARAERLAALAQAPRPALPAVPAAPAPSRLPDLSPALPWLGAVWIFGALAMGLRLAGGGWWLLRLRARTSPVPRDLAARAQGLARRMGLPAPELRLLPEAPGPFCYGLFRSVVVLPAACLAAMDADLLEALLAHEFAHLKRRDALLGALQASLDLLLFHHPLARWISSQARLERERACDEAAAAACGDARTIARALLELEDLRPPLAALAAQGAPLIPRIHALLGRSPRPTPLAFLGASLLLGGATLALAAVPRQTPPSSIQAPAALVRLADEAAKTQGLDPHLVRAIIQVESRFNPSARSPLGALGLMQVMPATAQRLGEDPSTAPEANLRTGTRYLRQLLDRYHGDTAKALLAYNAGPEALDRAEGVAPTEESRTYLLAVLDLYRRKAVESAQPGTFFGVLSPAGGGTWQVSLTGERSGNLDVIGLQDTPAGTSELFRISIGTQVGTQVQPAALVAPKVIFRLKSEGSPLRIRIADAKGSASNEISLPTAPLPSTFTLRLK